MAYLENVGTQFLSLRQCLQCSHAPSGERPHTHRVPFIVTEPGRDADPCMLHSTPLWLRRSGG
jgi:hypothetical protein